MVFASEQSEPGRGGRDSPKFGPSFFPDEGADLFRRNIVQRMVAVIPRNMPHISGQFAAMAILLIAAFAMGGGSRGDIQSLILLRPLSIVLIGYGLLRLTAAQIGGNRFLFGMALAIVGLTAVQLVPLPPAWWQSLPGRDLVVAIDAAVDLESPWRPISLAPDATRNALYSLGVPVAALVIGVQLDAAERRKLLGLILLLGGASGLLALVQLLGTPGGPFYLYRVTNDASAVGLFANRNHQALFLASMLPMLAVWAENEEHTRSRRFGALVLALLLLPLILITGSRLGIVAAALGLLSISFIFINRAGRERLFGAIAVLLLAAIILLTIWMGRGLAWQRLFESAPGEDMRTLILPTMLPMIRNYLPLGTGFGSFERVYQLHEPPELLSPLFMNHAHNDWLELLLTGGLPAAFLAAIGIAAFGAKVYRLVRPSLLPTHQMLLARLGAVLISLAAVGSLADYPLRTPLFASLFVVAVLWMTCPVPESRPVSAASHH